MLDPHPWGRLLTQSPDEANVLVMGIPFDLAVSCGKGAAHAPEKIRHLSRYMPATTETGMMLDQIKVYDVGDIPLNLDWAGYFQLIEAKAYELLSKGKFSIFLGGDHSVTIPLHKAFGRVCADLGLGGGKKPKYGVLHFDAHCDLCHAYDGHCWSHACTERRSLEGVIEPRDLTLLGIRSFEEEEVEFLAHNPEIKIITALDIHRHGIEAAFEQIKERFRGYDAVYFTLDIDVLDPGFAPGTGTPEAGGLSNRELLELVKLAIANLPVLAMDIVEVSPSLDISDITSWAALKNIYEVFGCLNEKYKSKT